MIRSVLVALLALPLTAGAATTMLVASGSVATSGANTYAAASKVTVAQPLPADLITAAATVRVNAPVRGDILAAGASVSVDEGAGGDVRVAGGRVSVTGDVGGDLAAAGGYVEIVGSAQTIYAAGSTVTVSASSSGNVTIYGANVTLGGSYGGNVHVVASNRFTLAEGTHIRGSLTYSAPEQLAIPRDARVENGAEYAGPYAYVPTSRQAHQYALLGTAIFFAVRMLAGVIVAGLFAGLFPLFSESVAQTVTRRGRKTFLQYLVIGAAFAVITPLLCLFLLISLVGAELALMLIVLYAFVALLAYAFCGIVLGYLLRRFTVPRFGAFAEFGWRDAALGTVCVHIIALIPVIGTLIVVLFAAACSGALMSFAYRQAFVHHG